MKKACLSGPAGVERARANLLKERSPLEGFTEAERLAAQTAFGTFEDAWDADGYLTGSSLRLGGIHTPRPYLHLMSSLHAGERGIYGSFWDATGRGFSCLDSVLAGPVTSHTDTSYVPTAPGDPDYRAFHLCEWRRPSYRAVAPHDVWSILPQPGRDEDRYQDFECRQTLNECQLRSTSRDIEASLHVYVAADDPLESWTLRLRNLGRQTRHLALFSRVNWGLRSYPGYYFDMRVVSRGLFDSSTNSLAAFNDDQNNRHPRSGVLMSDTRIDGYDLSREFFDGDGVNRPFPEAVLAGRCRNSLGRAPLAGLVGAIQQNLTLKPGETLTIRTLLGAASSDTATAARQRRDWRRRFLAPAGHERELARVRKAWQQRCGALAVRSGDIEVDRLLNVWSKYQAHQQSRFIRALDMVGYRDILQDLMGICDFDPQYVRASILTALSYQLPDGRAIRQYSKFEGAPHDRRMYMDSPVWIADTLVTYIQETGDTGILDENVGFFDPESGAVSGKQAVSVYEHALLSIRSCFDNRGQKGLCLAGHGDWNDALDGIGRGGRGVSTWLTLAVIFAASRLRELVLHLGHANDAAYLAGVGRTLTRAVNRYAWDGQHYVYGFNDAGEPIGSSQNPEGSLHLNVNSWAVLTGVSAAGNNDRTAQVLQSLQRLRTPIGYLLLDPPYTQRSRKTGRIADMLPGLFENGSIYTHGQAFMAAALVRIGQGDEAWEALKMTLPSRTLPALSTTPPHQQSNFTVGRGNPDIGTQYYSNFSGSLDWYRRTLIHMFGVVADFDGLRISPCVPCSLREYDVRKDFRGCRYHVHVSNPEGRSSGVRSIVVNGRPIKGNLVALSSERVCYVEVTI